MSGKTFVDTNILIYAHDADAGRKYETARAVLRQLWGERAGVLSTQVLQEFYVKCDEENHQAAAEAVGPRGRGQLYGLVHRHHASRNLHRFPHRG